MRRQRESELNSGTFREVQAIGLAAFAEEHLSLMEGQVTCRTLEDQRATLNRFTAHCGDRQLSAITPRSAEGFFAERLKVVSPATANKDMRTLKAIFQRAVKRGYLRESPFRGVKPVREPERDIRVLTTEEVERLLAACPNLMWRAFVFLAATTGMRSGELCHLEWLDVDFDGGMVHVRCKEGHRTKSARNRVIALVPAARKLLARLRLSCPGQYVFQTKMGKPIGRRALRAFRRIVRSAGIPHCTTHDLRRTFISHLAMAGVNAAAVQKLAGHSSISTTLKHYTSILPEVLRAAPLRLPYAESVEGVSKVYRGEETDADAERTQVASLSARTG
jgi:integrase